MGIAYFSGVANPDTLSIDGCLNRWLDSVPAMAYPVTLNKIPVYTSRNTQCIVFASIRILIFGTTTLLF